jgi:hypothetical protein
MVNWNAAKEVTRDMIHIWTVCAWWLVVGLSIVATFLIQMDFFSTLLLTSSILINVFLTPITIFLTILFFIVDYSAITLFNSHANTKQWYWIGFICLYVTIISFLISWKQLHS